MPAPGVSEYCAPVQPRGQRPVADYYRMIARAIAGLDPLAPGESRRALYERSRAALISQLRTVQPALSEGEVTRERLSLEEAIRRVETEVAKASAGVEAPYLADDPAQTESDPLAELARLIGQTDPFANRYDDALYGARDEVTAVHPLHRYADQRSVDLAPSDDEPVIPAGPPAWLEEVRRGARNVADEIMYAPKRSTNRRHLRSYQNKTSHPRSRFGHPAAVPWSCCPIRRRTRTIQSSLNFICASVGNSKGCKLISLARSAPK
jgi:hypothetical protein